MNSAAFRATSFLTMFQIQLCGSNLEAMYDKKIPMRLLPVEYLPDDYTGPNMEVWRILSVSTAQCL